MEYQVEQSEEVIADAAPEESTALVANETDGLTPDTTFLRVLNGPGRELRFPLNGSRMVIGRSTPPEVVVDIDLTKCEMGQKTVISRRHALLQWENGILLIRDLGSTNGTLVNGERLFTVEDERGKRKPSAAKNLKDGDRLMIANVEVRIEMAKD